MTRDELAPTRARPDPLLRPEVLALQERAEGLRAEAERTDEWVDVWTQLRDDCCEHGCDDGRCYKAWKEYPDG